MSGIKSAFGCRLNSRHLLAVSIGVRPEQINAQINAHINAHINAQAQEPKKVLVPSVLLIELCFFKFWPGFINRL